MGEGEKEEEHTGGQQPHSPLPARAETRKGQMEGIQLPQARHSTIPRAPQGNRSPCWDSTPVVSLRASFTRHIQEHLNNK